MVSDPADRRAWNNEAIRKIEADFNRTSDTHLILHRFLAGPDISIYFKDESSHPTGSLKHRLARSLFLYALSNDWIGPDTTVIVWFCGVTSNVPSASSFVPSCASSDASGISMVEPGVNPSG